MWEIIEEKRKQRARMIERKEEKIYTIKEILKGIKRKIEKEYKKGERKEFVDLWISTVGEDVARNTEVISWKNGVLKIKASGHSLYQELMGFKKLEILSKIQKKERGNAIKKIVFVLEE